MMGDKKNYCKSEERYLHNGIVMWLCCVSINEYSTLEMHMRVGVVLRIGKARDKSWHQKLLKISEYFLGSK
jgi:hypothetical protein